MINKCNLFYQEYQRSGEHGPNVKPRNTPAKLPPWVCMRLVCRSDSPDLFAFVNYAPEGWVFASEEEERQFFQDTLEFLKTKFGAENLAYAVVHRDQGRSHMQVAFIPRAANGQWSSKYALPPALMRTIHKEYWEAVCKKRGMPKPEKAIRPHLTKEELIELNRHRATELAKIQLEIANAKADADRCIKEAMDKKKIEQEGRKEVERSFALLQQKAALVNLLLEEAERIAKEGKLTIDEVDQFGRLQEQGRDFLADAHAVLSESEQNEFNLG